MGAWGTSISSNDTYQDVYRDFFDLYNSGMEVKDISAKLISKNQDTIEDPDDCNNFWFALIKSQWECKQIDQVVLTKVKLIIETEADIEVWRALSADENDIRKRKIALAKFLEQLNSQRPKAKARKKKIIRNPFFDKGDCLVFKFPNGSYGGVIVLEAIYNTEYPYVLLATTRINQFNKPTKQDFISSEVLVLNFKNWNNKLDICWMIFRKKETTVFLEKVDSIEISQEYCSKMYDYSFSPSFDLSHVAMINNQFQHEMESKQLPTKRLTVTELL